MHEILCAEWCAPGIPSKIRKESVFSMKKFFALLVAAAMLFCMAAIPAAADGVVTFTVGTVNNVNPGDTVTVPVSISAPGGYEAHTLTMHVQYNAEYLTVKKINNGEIWNNLPDDAMKVKDFATHPGDISIGITCPTDPMTGSGVFFTVEFEVAASCTEDQVLTVTSIELYNYPLGGQATPIETAGVNGAINLVNTEPAPTEPAPTEPAPTEPAPTEPTPVDPGQMSAAFSINPATTVAEDGSTITLTLYVSGSYAAHTMNVAVDYDSDALELVDVQRGAALNAAPDDAAVIVDATTVDGSVRLGLLAPTDAFTATGALLVLTFNVAEDFADEYPNGTLVTVAVPEFDNMPEGAATGTAIPCTVSSGVVMPKDNGGDTPGPGPNPPVTGAVSLVGLGILAIASGAGVVFFRKKED